MTDQGGFTLSPELLEQIVTNGFNYLPEIIREMINMAMRFERQQYLGAAPYQRTFEYPHLFLDAHYEKVRQDGQGRDAGVQIASGVDLKGKRHLLGGSVSLSEHEIHWRAFLDSLVNRGLRGVQLMISDDHAGLKAARITVFGGIPWQRCQFHLQQNASAYVPKRALLSEVAADIRAIFNAPDLSAAEAYLQKTVHKCEKSASKLARWMETNIPEGLTVFAFPAAHRCLIRTTNGLERISRELRRRTRTVNILPNEASCLHLVSEILMGIEDAWQDSHIYMRMDGDEPTS